jgi:hypothetical protein
VVSAALVATQRCGKHTSAAVNQHARGETVFSVGTVPRLYNEDLRQLKLELSSEVGSCIIMARKELGGAKKTS